jgi:ferrochelatase
MTRDAVLLMAYGGPRSLDEVEAYYTDIRRGVPPSPEQLEELLGRYRAIGGASPLSDIVERQRVALEAALARRGRAVPVYTGMRHIAPRIATVVEGMARDGIERFAAIALAPQRSSNGAGYRRAVEAGLAAVAGRDGDGGSATPSATFVESWHDEPGFIDALARATREALDRFEAPGRVRLLFTAHSLPVRVVAEGDRYPDEITSTARLVAERLGIADFEQCFQSAGRTGEEWLGPDLRDELRRLATEGVRDVVVSPVGFVAEHLEVLYDIDIEAQAVAREVGIHLERPRSMNDDPTFISALADVATRALGAGTAPPEPAPAHALPGGSR